MFGTKVASNRGELEIVYDVQWQAPGNDDDKAKIIGIVDTPDTNLDWNTFKSYLIQNSGNVRLSTDDIRISYLDSDDDLIPVDSELEFRECLKYSRIRARRGRKIVMKVSMAMGADSKSKDPNAKDTASSARHVSPKLFCLKKKDLPGKILLKKPAVSFEKTVADEGKDAVPVWFESYMTKFKADLIQEITTAVVSNVCGSSTPAQNPGVGFPSYSRSRNAENSSQQGASSSSKGQHHYYPHLHHVLEKRKKKKKMPEEDSSDCTDGLQLQWEERLELLRHMQKINKREKKFEKKLDAKLEKLECKTKKIMEKKHCLWNGKKSIGISASSQATASAPPINASASAPAAPASCDLVMDATPVDEYNYVPHILRGELVYQVWKIMNNGQLPWTDETELRFAWGSKSLVPLTTVVKCPPLKPGETGKVKVTLQAPLFPGNFESYWHFHHQGRRFGHWLGCAIIVDPDPRPDTPPYEPTNQLPIYPADQGPLPVDLTMKCQQQSYTTDYDNRSSTTDDMKIYNIETKPEVVGIKTQQEQANLLQQAPVKLETKEENSPKKEENLTTDSVQNIPNDLTTPEISVRCVTETELEEFPRLESYTNLSQTELSSYLPDSFPDLVQRNDETLAMVKPDLNAWANYLPHGAASTVDVAVADLLNIKGEQVASGEGESNVFGEGSSKDETEMQYDKVFIGLGNMRIMDDGEKKNNGEQQDDADAGEYISGSDSDNISIISGTVSVDTDDSEPSDEFVVVPMPTCLNCDQPIDSQQLDSSITCDSLPVTQPISVEIPNTPSDSDISAHAVQASDNNNNMELKPYPEMPVMLFPTLLTGEYNLMNTAEANSSEAQQSKPDSDQKSDDENTVYLRDPSGISIPVAKVVLSRTPAETDPLKAIGISVGVRHSTFGDPNFGHGPNGPRFPFSFGNESPGSTPLCHNPGGACNFRPQHESPVCSSAHIGQIKVSSSGETFCNHFCQSDKQQTPPQPSNPTQNHPNFFCSQQQQQQQQQDQSQPQQQPQSQQQQQQQKSQSQKPCPRLFRTHCLQRSSTTPPTYYPFDTMYQRQEMASAAAGRKGSAGPAQWANAYHNIHTEQPRACKYTYVYNTSGKESSSSNSATGSGTRSSSSSRRSTSNSRETSPVASAVQILPETLVTGAVNVASSAINTARSVIDMLRPRHEEPLVAQWDPIPVAMESSLHTLNEMGFKNRELNIMLLKQHNNDVTRVISELVQ